jgi:isoleucyl-tRNA synthetase
VHLETWPSFAKASTDAKAMAGKPAGKPTEIIKEMEMVRKIVELGLAERDKAGIKVRQPLAELRIMNYELRIEYKELVQDEMNVKNILSIKGEGEISVELDTEISDELKLEGVKRDIVRQVNMMRKDMGMTINNKVSLNWQSDSHMIKEVFAKLEAGIKKDTLSEEINNSFDEADKNKKEVRINSEILILLIKKI